MKRILAILMASLLAAVSSSYGTVYFQNAGNLSGWGNISTGANCYLTAVGSPSYGSSGGSIEAQCYYTVSGVRYHAEPTTYGTWNSGTKYFGYALYLDPSWNFNGTDRNVTEQYGTEKSTGGTIKPDNYQAWVKNHTMQFTAVNGSDENSGTISSAGTWHTVVTKMTYGSGGNVTVWFDGNQAWSVNGTVLGGAGGITNGLWAVGLYEADWDGGNTGNGTAQFLYNAGLTIASSYNEADPIQNFGSSGSFSGYYKLVDHNSGSVAAVSHAATTNNAAVILYTFGSSQNDQWQFVATDSGYYKLLNRKSGLAMAVKGASTSDGALIIQYTYGSSQNDQWQPVSIGGGYYNLKNRHSGLLLDVQGAGTANNTPFDQFHSNGGNNQQFQIISTN